MSHQPSKRRALLTLVASAAAVAAFAVLPPVGIAGGDQLDPLNTVSTLVDSVSSSSTTSTTEAPSEPTTTTTTAAPPSTTTTTTAPATTPTTAPNENRVAPALANVPAFTREVDPQHSPNLAMALPGQRIPPTYVLDGSLPASARGPRSTLDLVAAFQKEGVSPALLARMLAPFPVAGAARYSDDWGATRHVPYEHIHQGTDIFAQRGTPVIAAAEGTVSGMTTDGLLGGISLRITMPNGTFFYYAHLDRFADDLSDGQHVALGDIVGYVGNTGNASGTAPHLHFEVHPEGGPAVPPVPYLDRWLADASQRLEALTGSPVGGSALTSNGAHLVRPYSGLAKPERASSVGSVELAGTSRPVATPLLVMVVLAAAWGLHRLRRRSAINGDLIDDLGSPSRTLPNPMPLKPIPNGGTF